MRAVVFHAHADTSNGYEIMTGLPSPTPRSHEVLIRVHYAALNRLDDWVRRGWPGLTLTFPHIPCSDFAGEIVGLGDHVTGWQLGQAVTANPVLWCGECRACLQGFHNRCARFKLLGENIGGTCAEYIVVPARNLVAVPAGFDLRKAAAASLVYLTAWHSLIEAGSLRPAEHVLIVGAGGGVNTAALQIARYAGCRVYVVAGSAEKAALAVAAGADWVHDRSAAPNWAKAVFLATDRTGVDMVVDNVGEATWTTSLRTLRPGGRLVTVGGTTGYDAHVPVNLIFAKHLRLIGSTMGTQDDYWRVMDLIFAGRLTPLIDSIFSMEEYATALARMMNDQHFGKILIDVANRP